MNQTVIEKAPTATQNERTATAQVVTRQPDGPGKRIGKRGELTGIGKVTPDGARIFRERLPQFQAEAAYWEKRIGTVHDFRVYLFDNDTRLLYSIMFDGDFKPYIADLIREVSPWLDQIFGGVWEGYKGTRDPGFAELVLNSVFDAEFFYAAYPEATRRDVEKALRVSNAFEQLLDATQT